MRLDDLRFFARVAALGNVSAAGREVGLSPSAASARLTGLEREVNAQLFNRTTRRIVLTEAGQVLLDHSSAALREMDAAFQELEEVTDAPKGLLRISSNVFFGRQHILPYLMEFRDLYPDIRLSLDFTDRIVDLMAEGYDLAIRGAPLPDSTLKARRLGGNQRVLCASPGYIARKGKPCSPADLVNHDCIGMEAIPVWYFNGPDGEIAHQVVPFITGDNGDFAYDAALCGLGLIVKSAAHVWKDLKEGRLVELLPDYPISRTGAIWAVYPPGRHTPPKISVFIDFLVSKYGRPAYWEAEYLPKDAS